MTTKPLQTQTVQTNQSVVDDKLKPTAEMHILVGGPYTLNGEDHRYGHAAIRIKTLTADTTYDFGRYGRTGARAENLVLREKAFSASGLISRHTSAARMR